MKPGYPAAFAVTAIILAGYMLLGHLRKETVDSNLSAVAKAYNQWKVDYKMNIHSAENDFRFKVFSQNLEIINKHNSKPNVTYTLGLNKFAHLTSTEFASLHFGLIKPENRSSTQRNFTGKVCDKAPLTIPDEIDWEAQGKVSKVKNQGSCGSCYATAALDSMESVLAMTTGVVNELSVQQLVDCSESYGNDGCCGGLPDYSFQYIVDHGIVLESDYPYKGEVGTCNVPANGTKFIISGYRDVTKNSPDALKAAVAKNPVAVGLEAAKAFQFYTGGIITGDDCGTDLDHTSAIVGYGTQNGTAFWKVKNAWGTDWGDKGYVYIENRPGDGPGTCGINQLASYPTDYC